MRILHVLDHSLPVQSGYAFRSDSILREQRALGWETFHLTSPKQGPASGPEESFDGMHFYRTPFDRARFEGVPVLGEVELMATTTDRLESA